MPIITMAPTHYSLDDFIAGANLAYHLNAALQRTPSSGDDFNAALVKLDQAHHAFLNADQLYRTKALSRETANGLLQITSNLTDVLQGYLVLARAVHQKLGLTKGDAEEGWCRAGWTVWKNEDLVRLAKEIEEGLLAIDTLMTAANVPRTIVPPKSLAEFFIPPSSVDTAKQASQSLSSPEKPSAEKPSGVKPSAEKTPSDTLLFEDALGRRFRLPIAKCGTWEGIEAVIREAFTHVEVLGPLVEQGKFDLVCVPGGDKVVPSISEQVILATISKDDAYTTMHMWPMPKAPLRAPPSPAQSFGEMLAPWAGMGAAAAVTGATMAATAATEVWKRMPSVGQISWPRVSVEMPKNAADSAAKTMEADRTPEAQRPGEVGKTVEASVTPVAAVEDESHGQDQSVVGQPYGT